MNEKKADEKKIICPIEFQPIQGYARMELQDGKIEKVPVNDQRLIGMFLPKTIENPHKILRDLECPKYFETKVYELPIGEMGNAPMPNISMVSKMEKESNIVRAKTPEKADVYDMANFSVIPKVRYVFINRNGEQDREQEKILCEIIFNGVQKEAFCILTRDISNLCKIIKKRYAIARIDFETKHVEKILEDEFRENVRSCKTIRCYYQQGWQMIDREMIYVNKSAKRIEGAEYTLNANLPLTRCNAECAGKSLLIAFDLYRDHASISTMITFSLLGVLYRPFREAGFPPKFLLFLYGKTGSMKTTIGKILFTQLADDKVRDTPRRIDSDTVVSFERALIESGYDTVTLIDDYSPAKSKKKKEEMANKLEAIIRLVGDMSTKSRSNIKLEDCRGEGVQGTVVLTGELRGKGLSSNLRCLYCKMSREKANTEAITWFQRNSDLYTTIISEFSEYVSKNWLSIVSYIKLCFDERRREFYEILKERRLVDAVVTLSMVSHIMKHFLVNYCGLDEAEIIKATGNVEEDIIRNAQMSQAISSEESPSIMFIKAINDLMRVGTIVLGTGKMSVHNVGEFDGFDDASYFYFNPEMIFKKVRSFLLASNVEFSMDLKEMIVALYDDGFIKTASNGKGKRTYCVRIGVGDGKKQNFLKISKEVFRQVLDDSLDIIW